MKATSEEYREKLIPHIDEVYDIHIKSLGIKLQTMQEKANDLKKQMEYAKTRKKELTYNISRATDQDLTSFHYLFFGIEGKMVKEKFENPGIQCN